MVLHQLCIFMCSKFGMAVPSDMDGQGQIRPTTQESQSISLVIDSAIPNDRQMSAHRPDLVIVLEREKFIAIVEVSIPWEANVLANDREKQNKYLPLAADMASSSSSRVMAVPIIIGTLGVIDGLKKELTKTMFLDSKGGLD